NGYKIPDDTEERIEKDIFRALEAGAAPAPVELAVDHHLDDVYADHLARTVDGGLHGFDIIADCANGGASQLAPALFERLGANVHTIGAAPDGRNINLNCGSLHLDHVRAAVLERG